MMAATGDERGFLGRWARLKRDAAAAAAKDVVLSEERDQAVVTPASVSEQAVAPCAAAAPTAGAQASGKAEAADEPQPFDLSKLPPVESLGADSDYTQFLARGVPEELQRQALRRAWVTNPGVANFRGFADYDWDYNAPGYGRLLPTDDLARLCRSILGEDDRAAESAVGEPLPDTPTPGDEGDQPVAPGAGMSAVADAGGDVDAVPAVGPEPGSKPEATPGVARVRDDVAA